MAGIGNTVETDLVGEHVEVWRAKPTTTAPTMFPIAAGRCRAVVQRDSVLVLFLEVLSAEDATKWWGLGHTETAAGREIGDVHAVWVGLSNDLYGDGSYTWIRLKK